MGKTSFHTQASVSIKTNAYMIWSIITVMNKAQGGADKTSTKLDDPLHQPVSLVPPRNVRLQGKTDMDSPSGSKGAFSSAPVHNYRHITAVPYAGGCWKAQVGTWTSAMIRSLRSIDTHKISGLFINYEV